jgi:hypothetical protein
MVVGGFDGRSGPTTPIVYAPEVHRCFGMKDNGGWLHHPTMDSPLFRVFEDGTVIECDECHTTWVSLQTSSGLMCSYWRREGWWERRKRERRARKQPLERSNR